MPGISANAKRNARRRQRARKNKREAKRLEDEKKAEERLCGICATEFCKKCPNCCYGKVPAEKWLDMGCECEAPRICILCSVTHVKNTATRKTAKCPWCRVDMDVTDVYDNADIRHSGTGRNLFEDVADLTLDNQ